MIDVKKDVIAFQWTAKSSSCDSVGAICKNEIITTTMYITLYQIIKWKCWCIQYCNCRWAKNLGALKDRSTSCRSNTLNNLKGRWVWLNGKAYFLDTTPKYWKINSSWFVTLWVCMILVNTNWIKGINWFTSYSKFILFN